MSQNDFECVACMWTGDDPIFAPTPSWCKTQHARCPMCGAVVEFILDPETEAVEEL
jgi:hypothetical protein